MYAFVRIAHDKQIPNFKKWENWKREWLYVIIYIANIQPDACTSINSFAFFFSFFVFCIAFVCMWPLHINIKYKCTECPFVLSRQNQHIPFAIRMENIAIGKNVCRKIIIIALFFLVFACFSYVSLKTTNGWLSIVIMRFLFLTLIIGVRFISTVKWHSHIIYVLLLYAYWVSEEMDWNECQVQWNTQIPTHEKCIRKIGSTAFHFAITSVGG